MEKFQFRVLYRQFLFRIVDFDLLSAHAEGDMNKLFGQFAALFVFFSVGLALGGLIMAGAKIEPGTQLIILWSAEHFLIATTMLVVGLFAILSWDSTFPNRRDVMMLAPLPVSTRTIFLAKIAATGTALAVAIGTFHIAAGFTWPFALNPTTPAYAAPALAYDPAMSPVSAAGLEKTLRIRPLAPGNGLTIGVWKHGEQRILTYGAAKPDSIFEIGSITKTFTALILAQMVEQGKTRLDEPVRALLPPHVAAKPQGFPGEKEITLLDLATHHSGLPPMPDNIDADAPETYGDYHVADLYEFLAAWGVARYTRVEFKYSNLGFALLGHALANRAGTTYQDLLEQDVTGPLSMKDTTTALSPGQLPRMIQGYDAQNRPVPPWTLDVLASAGAIHSTAGDILTYLKENLHPTLYADKELQAAISLTHQLQAPVDTDSRIGLAWIYDTGAGVYWHNGTVPGQTSYAFFDPKNDSAAVILSNRFSGLAQMLGPRIRAKLAGAPAVSLDTTPIPASGGALHLIRIFAAYWITMLTAGVFIFCSVLGVQGLAAQILPRRYFLRVSSLLQIAAFCLFVTVYFLEPKIAAPGQSRPYLEWSPSYWFLGLFQQLSGSPALANLAQRAWLGLAIALTTTAAAYVLSYLRTMRQIVEEPDITPSTALRNWIPPFGNPLATAVGQFSIRTLLRSRQHRLMFAFYLGVGFAATIFFVKNPEIEELPGAISTALLGSSILVVGLCIVGTRVAFSLPLDLRANWIFRIMPIHPGPNCLVARRRALYAIGVIPAWAGSAALFLSIWPLRTAIQHLVILALIGAALAEVCLRGTQKIPFTCSYLPGKSNFNITFLLSVSLIFTLLIEAARFERDAFLRPAVYGTILAAMAALAIGLRLAAPDDELQFEEPGDPALFALDLHRDGITPLPSD